MLLANNVLPQSIIFKTGYGKVIDLPDNIFKCPRCGSYAILGKAGDFINDGDLDRIFAVCWRLCMLEEKELVDSHILKLEEAN